MGYYITTTKFANECVKHGTYGVTQPDWLVSIDGKDIVFLPQFNYKPQRLLVRFGLQKDNFTIKDIIYPSQKYFYL